jgi:cadmium resistance protein CadD (predicted permease)
VPLVAGLKRIAEMRRRDAPHIDSASEETDAVHGALGRAATVAAVATSSAIDNVLVYASLFVGRSTSDISLISCLFGLLTAGLCLGACATAGSRAPVVALRVAAGRIAPFMTAAVGVLLLVRFGTFPWIYSLA